MTITTEISFDSLARKKVRIPAHLIRGSEFYQVPGIKLDGSYFTAPAELRLLEFANQCSGGALTLSPEVKSWYSAIVKREEELVAIQQQSDVTLQHSSGPDLHPYQRVGVDFMLKSKRSLLCDETGMGKSATTIVAVEESNVFNKVLLLCNKSMMEWWKDEIARWSQYHPPVHLCYSSKREKALDRFLSVGGWLIMNWEQLPKIESFLRRTRLDWLVADEAHKVKNRKTQRFSAMKLARSRYMTLVTGTPFANSTAEVWTLLHLSDRDSYPSYWRFYEMYVAYDEDYLGYRRIKAEARNAHLLARELRHRMLNRKKEDFFDEMPEKTYVTIPVQMTKRQQTLYEQMEDEMWLQITDGEEIQALSGMTLQMRLRQLASTVATVDPAIDESGKLDVAAEMCADMDGKVVVFAWFRAAVEGLSRRLTKLKIKHVVVMGGLGEQGANEAKVQFQEDPEVKVIIGTLGSLGESHTLTAASKMIFIEKHYNPAAQKQDEDRIHRIGQRFPCTYYSLICPDSVDDIVESILARKIKITNEVMMELLKSHLQVRVAAEHRGRGAD